MDNAGAQLDPSRKVSWGNQHTTATAQVFLSFMWFPSYAFLFFHTASSFWSHLVGILAGHLYFFVMYKYPQDFGGQVLISTPQIL